MFYPISNSVSIILVVSEFIEIFQRKYLRNISRHHIYFYVLEFTPQISRDLSSLRVVVITVLSNLEQNGEFFCFFLEVNGLTNECHNNTLVAEYLRGSIFLNEL